MLFFIASYAHAAEEGFSLVGALRSTYVLGGDFSLVEGSSDKLLQQFLNIAQATGELTGAALLHPKGKTSRQQLLNEMNKKLGIKNNQKLVGNKIMHLGPETAFATNGELERGRVVTKQGRTIGKETMAPYIREIEKANPKIKVMRYGHFILFYHAMALLADSTILFITR